MTRNGSPTLKSLLEGPLRSARRRAIRALPEDRRVRGYGGAKGRGLLQARKLVAPFLQLPVTLTTSDGLRLRISGDPVDEHIAQYLLGARRTEYFPMWETPEPAAPCILDIGAHHGLYAATALHMYPSSRVVCVEPSSRALQLLEVNLAINGCRGRARIVQAALSDRAGHAVLRHTSEGSWGHSLYEDEARATGGEEVALLPLERILDGDRPDIVKCNAEGAEFSLFDQLMMSDLRPTLMVVMVHPEFGDLDRLLGQADAMRYRAHRVGTSERPAFQMWWNGQRAD